MPTERELQQTYQQMQTSDLLNIIGNKNDYTELAVSVALGELKKRNVPADEIKVQKPADDPYKKLWMENCLFDLTFPQKAASYFLGMFNYFGGMVARRFTSRSGPLYSPGFKRKGYILKENQYNYYSVTGFSFFVISAIICNNMVSDSPLTAFLIYWVAGLGIAFLFDTFYNQQRLTGKLNDHKEQGELPWGA